MGDRNQTHAGDGLAGQQVADASLAPLAASYNSLTKEWIEFLQQRPSLTVALMKGTEVMLRALTALVQDLRRSEAQLLRQVTVTARSSRPLLR